MRRSTGRFYAFCAVIFAVGMAASGYLNYHQYELAKERQKLYQDDVAQLQRQNGVSGSSKAAPVAASPAVLGARTVKISELGISLTTWTPLSDLSYRYQQDKGLDIAALTTSALIKATTTCGPGALGQIVRQSTDVKATVAGARLLTQMGGYNYYYQAPAKPCAADPVSTAALKSGNAVIPGVLTTLSPLTTPSPSASAPPSATPDE